MIHDLRSGVILSDAADLHPAYFETRFRVPAPIDGWPQALAIVSGHATTDEEWTREENEDAHLELGRTLRERGLWTEEVTGYSPDTGHPEPGYAVELPLDDACDLGLRFEQDAIFYVKGDARRRPSTRTCRGYLRLGERGPASLGTCRDWFEYRMATIPIGSLRARRRHTAPTRHGSAPQPKRR